MNGKKYKPCPDTLTDLDTPHYGIPGIPNQVNIPLWRKWPSRVYTLLNLNPHHHQSCWTRIYPAFVNSVALFAFKFVTLYQQPGLSDVIAEN